MLKSQNDLFYLDRNVHYLNNAYMSPNLKSVEIAGIVAIRNKNKPYLMKLGNFFDPVTSLKKSFSRIVNCENAERMAIIPAASYGLANAARNLQIRNKKKIILPAEQFPSNYYIWERLAAEHNLVVQIINPPENSENRGELWNERIINAIDEDTLVVACSHVHWSDGTKFELSAFREKLDQFEGYLVIDGSQSIGALPFDIQEIRPDALITVGYKWLFGPYGIGFAYYNERFDNGTPIEENWINRLNSEDFRGLVNYESQYKPYANRYCVGENSKFIAVPMMTAALDQIKAWDVIEIQAYAKQLISPYLSGLREMGCSIEKEAFRGNHILGVRLPKGTDIKEISQAFRKNNINVSMRGSAIRVATSVYNNKRDMDAFFSTLHEELVLKSVS